MDTAAPASNPASADQFRNMVTEAQWRNMLADQQVERDANLALSLRKLIGDADVAQSYAPHGFSADGEPRHMIAQPTVRSMVASLTTSYLPGLIGKDGRVVRAPNVAPAGVTLNMAAGLVSGSRIARAGARVIVASPAVELHPVGYSGGVVVERIPVALRNIEAAAFATVAGGDLDGLTFATVDKDGTSSDDADAPAMSLPVFCAEIDWRTSISKGVRFEIPRSERRRIDPDQLCSEILTSLSLGLSRAADDVLLSALGAANLAPFTVANVAAAGLHFDELRALIGTAGIGAVIGQDGVLRAAGVLGELTGDSASTFIGAWNRAGVAVNDEITIYAERLGKADGMAVTAWASMLSLVPDTNKFWTVA
ncbi:hypothetical protein P6166_14580 [Stenotrophomonas sp. HITSZ_GD]|uniref:hypothetical protein n=1 Tax=Stenotrophomonas sp. HITSZ_GD TaxID=3037248 RepID=UPI00240D4311|nr:hypothetical protein [Stenotrophomonas sp. HITSZ_GD]MDG2526580.1 hypothetical protein [Stenotrophomonas sp. HITSZ_GD]